jgi:hypothetical protein
MSLCLGSLFNVFKRQSEQTYLDHKKYDALCDTTGLYERLEEIKNLHPRNFSSSSDLKQCVKEHLKALQPFYLDGNSEDKALESFKKAALECERTKRYIVEHFDLLKGDPLTLKNIKLKVSITVSKVP